MTKIDAVRTDNSRQNRFKNEFRNSMSALSGNLALAPLYAINALAMSEALDPSKNLPKDEVNIVNKAVDKLVQENEGLGKKGVKIMHFGEDKIKPLNLPFKLPNFIREQFDLVYAVAKGRNAAFFNFDVPAEKVEKNTVCINREKASLSQFHELGHAFNFNNTKILKAFQSVKMRKFGMNLGGYLALYNAFSNDVKPGDDKELTPIQKLNNHIRKFSPLYAFAAITPMLIEEGMASVKGCEWAKQILDKKMYNKVLKTNAIAYVSYLSTAGIVALSPLIVKKVKDILHNKSEQKV